jgi:hypothetical protein
MTVPLDTPPIRRASAEREFEGDAGAAAAIAWAGALDPRERLDFVMDLSGLLDPVNAESVSSWSVAASLEAAAAGVVIEESAPFAPALIDQGRAMRIWASVAPGAQADAVFAGSGIAVEITATAGTTTAAARQRFRSFLLTVRRR